MASAASAIRTRCGSLAVRFVAAVGLAVAALGAHADVIDIAWNSAGRFDTRLSVLPGQFAEVCGKLSEGQAVAWTFSAAQPMDFNIHYHLGQELHFPARQDQSLAAQGVLDPSGEHVYCWMWTHTTQGAAVELSVSLQRR